MLTFSNRGARLSAHLGPTYSKISATYDWIGPPWVIIVASFTLQVYIEGYLPMDLLTMVQAKVQRNLMHQTMLMRPVLLHFPQLIDVVPRVACLPV